MNEISCPYCGSRKALGFLCPDCGRAGKKVFEICYRSRFGVQKVEEEDFDKAQDMVARIINAGCFLLGIKEKEVQK